MNQTTEQPFVVIIPSRYASTRLPGKPLIKIGDKTLIQHVCERASESSATRVIVATDSQCIDKHIKLCGFESVMTSTDCQSGTDRISQAAQILGLSDEMVVVNLQGDEPFMPAQVIDQIANSLVSNEQADMSTGCERITDQLDIMSPDVVKVVTDKSNLALYFSRSFIPFSRDDNQSSNVYKHLGIYAYRVGFIKTFAALDPCSIERSEKLEQLRALWHGYKISVAEIKISTGLGVDTPADLEKARNIYQEKL